MALKKISLWFGLLQTIFIYCILNKVIWLKRIEGPKIRDSECENGLEIYARFLFKALK